MNKEQIEEAKRFFDENFEFFNYKKELTKETCIALMNEYLESKRSEIERKAYEAGYFDAIKYDDSGAGYDQKEKWAKESSNQWKESQNQEI